ncbi:MAG: DUF72 domain-containing protein [Bacteroidia bacterium]|jgi:uncharacterized protein YecE (DUF72 family)|nr:DUF72 domain-containing protein [Bacteroidia bacterium]
MDFGRLPDISQVDFTLPPDPAHNTVLLHSISKFSPLQLWLGCPVWGEKNWAGLIYPANAKEKDFLRHYGTQFNCIELNSTYYRIPTPQTVQNWAAAVPEKFRFCPKIPQEISHTRQLLASEALTEAFCLAIMEFGTKLGTAFLQLPPHFGPQRFSILRNYLEAFPREIPLAVEFREENWFTGNALEEACAMLEELHIATVITDTAGRRDVLHQRLTTTTAFIRFTANDLHPTDFPRTQHWATQIAHWQTQGLETLYFFVHSPSHALMPKLTRYAAEVFNQLPGIQLTPCRFLDEQQPTLF